MNIPIYIGSPNQTPGRGGYTVSKIVIHWMDGTLASTDAVFQKAGGVSAHYGIENNVVHQYVKEENTAYHAGDWTTNLRSIGIEHSAQPGRNASEATYASSIELCTQICKKYNLIPDKDIVPHNSIVATQCPGTIDLGRIKAAVKTNLQGGDTMDYKALYELLKNERDTVLYPYVTDVSAALGVPNKADKGLAQLAIQQLRDKANQSTGDIPATKAEVIDYITKHLT